MASPPQGLTLEHARDLVGRERRPWTRRALLGLLGAFLLLGLANVFGQRPSTSHASSTRANLEVYSPTTVRSGLFYESRFRVAATEGVRNATLVLDRGWLEGITLNTVTPGPVGEASRDGRIAFELGRIPAGQDHVLFLDFQVNPTTVGRRSADVELYDGEQLLARIDRTITVWP
jgi:hypothetical protein